MPKSKQTGTRPVHKIRHGAVNASIWRKDTERGPMFNVTFQRSYRNGEDWKNTGVFGRRDLLALSLIATRAFEWVAAQVRKATLPTQPPELDDVPF